MASSRDDVLAAVQASFAEGGRSRVMRLLDAYGVKPYERERHRVQLAVVKLSMGSEEKLIEFVAAAKRDYRDILLWAEHPEESRLDTPEKKKRMIELFGKLGVKPPAGLQE